MITRKRKAPLEWGLGKERYYSLYDLKPQKQKAGDLVDDYALDETSESGFDVGVVLYQARQYEGAINATSLGLTALAQNQISLLDVRAAAYGLAGRLKLGMRDAKEIIRLAPSKTVGYRRAGELLSMYGYAHRAIKVYQQGLEIVDDRYRASLLDGYNAAVEQSADEGFDILASVPDDVVANITQYLTTDDCVYLLDVSKVWREKLLKSSGVWSEVKIEKGDAIATTKMSLLSSIGNYVTSMHLRMLEGDTCDAIFYHIAAGNFTKLEYITLHGCCLNDVGGFFSAIARVSTTLTSISVYTRYTETRELDLRFNTVLTTCRNLRTFRFLNRYNEGDPVSPGYIEKTYTSGVTNLSLGSSHSRLSDIEDTLRDCPELQQLTLLYVKDSANLDFIGQYCKNLVSFSFNAPLFDQKLQASPPPTNEIRGIRHLGVEIDDPGNFVSLFSENFTTIISLNMIISHTTEDLTPLLPADNFSNLHYLKLSFNSDEPCHFASRMIAKAPNLRQLTFQTSTITSMTSIGMAAMMTNLVDLDKLEFLLCDTGVGGYAMSRIINSIAARGNSGTLREVVVHGTSQERASMEYVLKPLSKIPTLCRIEFRNCDSTAHAMTQFCAELQLHGRIEDIVFEGMESVEDKALDYLYSIQSLRRLELSNLDNITKEGVLDFNDSVTLIISNCANVNDTKGKIN